MINYIILLLAIILVIGAIFYLRKNHLFKEHQSFVEFIGIFLSLIFALITINQTQEGIDSSTDDFDSLIKRLDNIVTKVDNATKLFNEQLNSSRQLNDSLIHQVTTLQEITNNQLKTSGQQLIISESIYKDQLYTGRPNLILLQSEAYNLENIIGNTFLPTIEVYYKNIGRRIAENSEIRTFIVFPDFRLVMYAPDLSKKAINLEETIRYKFIPNMSIDYKDEYYFCIDFNYYDSVLKQSFYQAYYLYHNTNSTDSYFTICRDEMKSKVKNTINNKIEYNVKKFDEQNKN